MRLNQSIARRIIDRVAQGQQVGVSVALPGGKILASTEPGQAGAASELAALAAAANRAEQTAPPAALSIAVPLCFQETVVGALVLHRCPSYGTQMVHMARALAELIIHQHVTADHLAREQWAVDRLLFDLLRNRVSADEAGLLHQAALLQIDLRRPRVVVVVEIAALDDAADGSLLRQEQEHERWGDQARAMLGAGTHDLICWASARHLVLLPEIEPRRIDATRERAAAAARQLVQALTEEGLEASAGIGRYYPAWQQITQSYDDARFALDTGVQLYGPGQVYFPLDLGLAAFVCSEDRLLKGQIADMLLRPLDAQPDLRATLERFFAAELSPSNAARALSIHRHTLDYRLAKIADLTGLDPRQFHGAAMLQAAMLLQQTCRPPETAALAAGQPRRSKTTA